MKPLVLTIAFLMLALIAFGGSASRKKLRVEMFFDEPPMEDEQVDQEEVWSAIRYLDPDERDSIADGALQCVARLVAVLSLAMSVSQAAEGEEAFTLVGSVK
jgi:hypothetical protein